MGAVCDLPEKHSKNKIATKIQPKPSLKIETAKPHLLELSWPIKSYYGLNHIFFLGIELFFFKIESWNFQHLFENKIVKPFKISSKSDNEKSEWVEWVEILWGFFFFKQILKVSAFYLEKEKKVLFLKTLTKKVPTDCVCYPNFHWRFWIQLHIKEKRGT